MHINSGTPAERLGEFYDFMWGETPGHVCLATKNSAGEFKRVYQQWPEGRTTVVHYTLRAVAEGNDVYFAPAIFTKPKAIKENVKGSHVLWADYDGTAPDDWSDLPQETLSPAPGASLSPVDHDSGVSGSVHDQEPSDPRSGPLLPMPSLRVQSSGPANQHAYWKLKEFCEDIAFIESANRAITYITDADKSGWDVNQVLRPIETSNFKKDKPVRVIVYSQENVEYAVSDFHYFKPPKEYISNEIDTDNLPDITTILGAYRWDSDELALLRKQRSEIPDGARSSSLMRLGYYCAELGLSEQEIYAILIFCDDKWGKYKGRNDRKRRLVEIVNRAKQRHPHALASALLGIGASNVPEEIDTRVVYGFRDFAARELNVKWIIENTLPQGGLGMFVSAPGVGKTQLTMALAANCALGSPLLIWTPVAKHKVLYFHFEMHESGVWLLIQNMKGQFTEEEMELLNRNFLIAAHGQAINLATGAGWDYFWGIIDEFKPDGIYIDSFQRVHPDDLTKDEPVRKFFAGLAKLRAATGAYVILVHHDRKATDANKRPRDLSDIYGNVYVSGEPDWIVNLWKPSAEAKAFEVRTVKSRYAEVPDPIWVRREDSLRFSLTDKPGEGQTFNAPAKLLGIRNVGDVDPNTIGVLGAGS